MRVNKNYLSALRMDKNNLGPSQIVGVGDYTEGGLWVMDQGALDCRLGLGSGLGLGLGTIAPPYSP